MRQVAAAGALIACALGAGLWWGGTTISSEAVPILPISTPGTDGAGVGGETVHVSGAVRNPGLVFVVSGSRVADAIAAADGALPEADLASLNLAAPVRDGDHIAVPWRAAGGAESASPGGDPVQDGRVRINVAAAAELEALPGVGPVLAGRIVAHREAYGPFAVVEDLLDVPGIGEAKLAALRDVVLLP